MIKDLEMLYDISPLFEKKIIIWGAGYEGCTLLKEIKEMGAGKLGITLCDADPEKWGKEIDGIEVISPYSLEQYFENVDLGNIIICILVQNLDAQDEILNKLTSMRIGEIDVYTSFGVKHGIYYGLKSPYINDNYRQKKIMDYEIKRKQMKSLIYRELLQYLAYIPLHNDEIVMVYQPESYEPCKNIYASIKMYDKNVFNMRHLEILNYIDSSVKQLINMKSGKIICVIREPISFAFDYMWNNIGIVGVPGGLQEFSKIDISRLIDGFEDYQLKLYNEQICNLFGINVLEYPFDKEKGYQIIKSENIELLLLKMERIDELVHVIGEFLGINGFQFYNMDIHEVRSNRFAIEEYKKRFKIPLQVAESIYKENSFVKHFYTENECEKFITQFRS